jgi:hypothetical protein
MTTSKKTDTPEGEDRCFCGAVLEKADPKSSSSEKVCPSCGATTAHDTAELSAADTQMLNISEMARMAQEGVDPSAVSGEWVTVLDHKPEQDPGTEED